MWTLIFHGQIILCEIFFFSFTNEKCSWWHYHNHVNELALAWGNGAVWVSPGGGILAVRKVTLGVSAVLQRLFLSPSLGVLPLFSRAKLSTLCYVYPCWSYAGVKCALWRNAVDDGWVVREISMKWFEHSLMSCVDVFPIAGLSISFIWGPDYQNKL